MDAVNWTYDREINWHIKHIPQEDDAFVFVYKTPAGDYAVSAMREGDCAGGDVSFMPTLKSGKRFAEDLITTGTYKDFFL